MFKSLERYTLFTKIDPRLRAELATQKRPLAIGFACTVVAATTGPATALLLSRLIVTLQNIAKVVRPELDPEHPVTDTVATSMHNLLLCCGAVVGLYAFRYWFVRGQTYYLSEASNRLAMNLRLKMLRKLLNLPISYFNDRRSGAIQSVLTNDVNVYQNAVGLIRDSVGAPIKAILSLIVVLALQWQLAALASMIIPIMAFVIQRNSRKMKASQRRVQEDLSLLNATTVEVLQGTRIVKAFGAEAMIQSKYEELVEETFRSQMKATETAAYLGPLQDLIGAFSLALVIYICGLFAKAGELTIGEILAIGYSLDQINQGLRALGGITNTYATVQAASDRIYSNILEVPIAHELQTGTTLEHPRGELAFEGVSFHYPDGTQALDNVSFTIAPGTSLALVGPSGAGKSTIADLVLRFYDPSAGRILFDGIDIRELDIQWLRAQIGVVPQQTFLFANSIDENVKLGNPEATEGDLKEALHLAHATEFAMNFRPEPRIS